jgi:uracil-DNA glycosylase family 4
MVQIGNRSSKVTRDLVLLTPKLSLNCPHCNESLRGNELIALSEPIDLFNFTGGAAGLGINQVEMNRMSHTIVLPVHAGISPQELVTSAEISRNPPLEQVYSLCLNLHNLSPYANKKTFVWGSGNPATAKVLMIGEAPGWQEDKFGINFIGDAGQVLSGVLNASGISRANDVMLINTVCTIPDRVHNTNDIGKPSTLDLLEQRVRVIDIIRTLAERPGNPLVAVVCLGKYSWVQLAENKRLMAAVKKNTELNMRDISINRVKGWHSSGIEDVDVPVLTTFHPSYIMRIVKSSGNLPSEIPEVVEYLNTFTQLGAKINAKR